MKAEEAERIATENLKNVLPQKEYDSIMKNISFLTSIGSYTVWKDSLHKKTIELFRKDGYKVRRSFIGGYIISWKK